MYTEYTSFGVHSTLSREHMTAHSLAQDQVARCKNVRVVPTRISILSLMSLLNIPFVPFPSMHSAPSATSSRVSTSFPDRTRSWCQSPSVPPRWSESGGMADPAPNTGYEPNLANFSSYVDPEHTPIDVPDSHQDFLCPDDATMIPTSPEGLPNAEAFSSSQKAAAGRVSSLFGHSSLGKLSAGHVSSRSGLQETGAELDRDSVATTLFRSQSRGKRDRDRQKIIKKHLERKVDSAVRSEQLSLQKLCEAVAEVEVRNWEERNSDIALYEKNQEFESQRVQPHQATRWADQDQSDRISLYGELELRNRLFQENHARDSQEIQEVRRICCEETEQARQARSEELSVQQQCNPATVNQMMARIRGSQNKVNSLSDARDFLRS